MRLLFLFVMAVALAAPADAAAAPRTPASASTPLPGDPAPHARFLARGRAGPVGMLFLGDSILAGWPVSGAESWEDYEDARAANFSVPGEATEQLLWRITHGELDGIQPGVVVVLIGTNNLGHFADEKPAWTAAGIAKIVRTVRARLPRSKVLLLGLLPRGKNHSIERVKARQVNKIISHLDDGKNVRYLDVGGDFLDDDGAIRRTRMRDGLHPTSKGYDKMAESMAPLLRDMTKPPFG